MALVNSEFIGYITVTLYIMATTKKTPAKQAEEVHDAVPVTTAAVATPEQLEMLTVDTAVITALGRKKRLNLMASEELLGEVITFDTTSQKTDFLSEEEVVIFDKGDENSAEYKVVKAKATTFHYSGAGTSFNLTAQALLNFKKAQGISFTSTEEQIADALGADGTVKQLSTILMEAKKEGKGDNPVTFPLEFKVIGLETSTMKVNGKEEPIYPSSNYRGFNIALNLKIAERKAEIDKQITNNVVKEERSLPYTTADLYKDRSFTTSLIGTELNGKASQYEPYKQITVAY